MESQAIINTFNLGEVVPLTSTRQERRQRMQFTADDKVPRFWKRGFHYRKVSNVSDEDAAIAGSPVIFPDFKITADHGSLLACKNLRSGKSAKPQYRHRGTRHKAIFGFEDADAQARGHGDLFGIRDAEYHQNTNRFGFEDTAFKLGKKGRNLFGSDDCDTASSRKAMEIFGRVDADAGEYDKTRHIFGDENAEDSDEEDYVEDKAGVIFVRGVEGELVLTKDVRHNHRCVHWVEKFLNSFGASFSKKHWKVKRT